MKWLLSVTLAAALAGPVEAAMTGNQLMEWCDSEDENLRAGCFVYTLGAIQGMHAGSFHTRLHAVLSLTQAEKAKEAFEKIPIVPCTPEKNTGQQLVDVAIAYMKKHPELRHKDAPTLIYLSLSEAFPCG